MDNYKHFFENMNPIAISNLLVLIVGIGLWILLHKYYKKTKSRVLLNAVPNIWTSLGVLGTFISICFALSGIQKTPLSNDVGKTLQEVSQINPGINIKSIISDLIPAFSTSIYGLLGALIATLNSKRIFAKEDAELDKNTKKKSPEECLYHIYTNSKDIKDNLLDQEKRNRDYNDQLNKNISSQSEILEKFINDFVGRMDSIFQQMHGAIETQVKNFGDEQFKKSSSVLQGITQQMTDISSSLIAQQQDSVKDVMENTGNELQAITRNITNLVSSLAESTTQGLSTIESKQQEKLDNIVNYQTNFTSNILQQNKEFIEGANKSFQEEYQEIQESNVKSLEQMIDLKSAYEEVSNKMLEDSNQANTMMAENLRSNITNFVGELQQIITKQCNSLSETIMSNVSTLEESYSFIDNRISQIKSDYEQSTLSFRDAVQNAHNINNSYEKTITNVDNSLESVVETNKNINKLISVVENKQENIEALVVKIQETSNAIETLQKLESTLYKLSGK